MTEPGNARAARTTECRDSSNACRIISAEIARRQQRIELAIGA